MSTPSEEEVCRKERAETPPSLFQNGNIVFQTHHVGWIIAGCFTITAVAVSFWLVNKHLQWYTDKREQRYIVRILFLVPLYAIISLASYLWWNHATPIILIRDGYESTVLTAFFYLLLMYLSHDPDEQRLIFMKHGLSQWNDAERMKKGEALQRWVFPLGFVKWKPVDGLYFLQLMKWGVLQYCVIRPVTTLIAVILDYMGLYCETSWGLGWGHIYIVIVVSLSVTIAMYCLIQLYVVVSKDLARHKPFLKLFAIKAVVFLTFWQATFLSVLSMFGVVKDTKYMTAEDINIGIGALLETVEMTLFALLHIRAFTYKAYRPPHDPNSDDPPPERTPRLKSLGHAMDFRETFKELWAGCIYMWHKFRGREPALDSGAIRTTHYEGLFGKQRPTINNRNHESYDSDDDNIDLKEPTLPQVQVEVSEEVEIAGEKQWLGTGDNYGYGLKFFRRERSEGLEEQIEKELEKRGYTLRNEADLHHPKHPKQKSWWRSMYNRISQAGDNESPQVEEARVAELPSRRPQSRSRTGRQSQSRHPSRDSGTQRHSFIAADFDLEDKPPRSLMGGKNRRELRQSVDRWRRNVDFRSRDEDLLMPLPVLVHGNPGNRQLGGSSGLVQESPRQRHNDHSAVIAGISISPIIDDDVDPRQQDPLQSPGSEGRLERMFKGAISGPSAELNDQMTEITVSEISHTEGYRLAKPTPSTHLLPSQPSIIPANQVGMAAQRRLTRYHLADDNVHVPMTADIVHTGINVPAEHDEDNSTLFPASTRTHRAHPTTYKFQYPDMDDFAQVPGSFSIPTRQSLPLPQLPQAGPSKSTPSPLSPGSPTALRRSSAQYYSSRPTSRKRQSLLSEIDIPHPSAVSPATSPHRRGRPHHRREGPNLGETPNHPSSPSQSRPITTASPTSISPRFPLARLPTSPINDGLSRYPVHVSPTNHTISRHS